MAAVPRLVVPEILDELAPEDPRAQRSRRDLRKVHTFMRSPAILRRLLERVPLSASPRLIELGAGDGTLLLRVAQRLAAPPARVELTLLDRVDLLAETTREGYRRLGWEVSVVRADALEWARRTAAARYDACIVSLFLHHFSDPRLKLLLQGIARHADALVCIEPRRSTLARIGARCIGVTGAGAVTRSDSLASVDAGFRGRELSQAWAGAGQAGAGWTLEEFAAPPFTHCFLARRAPCLR